MISFVVPAYNEEAVIANTLNAIHGSARAVNEPYEIVVADDASTDGTAEIARNLRARVEWVNYRQIAATRNAGARACAGEFIFFVDADTLINPRTLRSALIAMKKGAAGGGAITWFKRTEALPAYVWLGFAGLAAIAKFAGFTGGSFMYCTRAAFDATGGFPAKMYWAEETPFGLALKREGKFVVPWTPITMSGRRFRASAKENSFKGLSQVLWSPQKIFTDRSVVQSAWYERDRTDKNVVPSGLQERTLQIIWFVLILSSYICILGSFVPRGWIPLPGAFGTIAGVVTIPIAHLGLALWPIAAFLTFNLCRQKRPTNIVQSVLLILFCVWLAWNSLHYLVETYRSLWHWLAGLVESTW
jgi:glycosyltransferase involved in cell wall biosynthesis